MTHRLTAEDWPAPPPRTPDTGIYIYGCQILAYILRADADGIGEVYGFLTDRDLEDAKYAAAHAIRAPEISEKALETIHTISVRISDVLAWRAAEAAGDLAQLPALGTRQGSPTPDSDRPNEGPMAPLAPRPINNPPAPAKAEPVWSF